ncbi:hypothetical protein [Shewanella khirikhana]|uniref:TadE-like protein n=1 Tax=Shewanella khirikhana TaxID=1965282 RepID=A0ABN5U1Q6_9GAMM|nr:hypothetical protein [Shewanella khirikhana]AZQ13269.1 hypothetical protein STH12_04243 [Shewanella khirikhana]
MLTTRYQNGVATTEFAIGLSCSFLLSVVMWVAVIRPLLNYVDAVEVDTAVENVKHAAKHFYGKDISQTHCYQPSKPLSLTNLINDQFIASELVIGKPYQLAVSYELKSNGSWSRPTAINIDVTFATADELVKVASYLDATWMSPTQLRFTQPIEFRVDWRVFNPATGCQH